MMVNGGHRNQGLRFSVEDKLDPNAFNHILWTGIKGEQTPSQ
jgi:hypothetical protein